MKSKLDAIESKLQALVENSLARLPWRSRQPRLAEQLIKAIRIQIAQEAGLDQPAANIMHIFMHPVNAAAWQAQSEWQTWLLGALNEIANEASLSFFAPPELSIKSDPALNTRELRLIAAFPAQEVGSTAVMQAEGPQPDLQCEEAGISAFLILQGKEVYPLNRTVINIGRRHDNHIVLDDLRASRNHAQIRNVRGRYTLFDLNSTGGTFVNGNRVTQQTLIAGDVISFAGISVIYGEESPVKKSGHDTSPAQAHSKEDSAP